MAEDRFRYFRVEARELLDQLREGAGALAAGELPGNLVPRLLRLAHTLKGAARVVKLTELAELAHAVEDTLAPLRGTADPAPPAALARLRELLDRLEGHVGAIEAPAASPAAPGEASPEHAFRILRTDVAELDRLLEGLAASRTRIALVRRGLATLERARSLAELLADQLRLPGQPRAGASVARRELGVAEELRGILARLERELAPALEDADRELRQVRETAQALRLVPAGAIFGSLDRAARDAAQSQGKQVVFGGQGGEVRLDAELLGALHGALVQLVRNAVAHGVELPAERRAAGKPPAGQVTLTVRRLTARVELACEDDGRGVDLEAVRRAARRRGHSAAEVARLTPAELLQLLLQGGMSTTTRVSEVAGRGVGLDIVREAATRLGGEVRVESEAGRGTRVVVSVPLMLSSFDALVVEAGERTAAIPLEVVRRAVRVSGREVTRTAAGEAIPVDGELVPFTPLVRPLGGRLPAPPPATWSAVVVESGGARAAVGVDRLLGTENVVLRPLPRLAPADAVVAGATFDAEGNPRPLLDGAALVAAARGAAAVPAGEARERPPILVVDDSLTTRMLEQTILESAGYTVELATSGEQALELAAQRRYGLFLVDVEMPGMDGFTFVARTRADEALRRIPAILITSRDSAEDRLRGTAAGASAYIVKSEFDQVELLALIERLLGER